MSINPKKASLKILGGVFGQNYESSPSEIVSIYEIKRFNSSVFGPTIQIYTLGCSYRCAMCWVHNEALGARSGWFVDKKIAGLPKALRAKSLGARFRENERDLQSKLEKVLDSEVTEKHLEKIRKNPHDALFQGQYFASDVYEYVRERILRSKGSGNPTIVHSGGSPTLYQGYLLQIGRLAKKDDLKIGVVTEGFNIAEDPAYLIPFSKLDLQKTMHWLVTIKNATPETFTQLTGVNSAFSRHHFQAIRQLLREGFFTAPILVLDTFASLEQLAWPGEKNPVNILHQELSFGTNYPSLLSLDKVYYGQFVNDSKSQRKKMNHRGYQKNFPGKVRQRITEYFLEQETPIVKFSPEDPVMEKGKEIIEETIKSLR